MDAALQALSKFSRLAESHRVDEIVAAATSAVREADNGGDFLAEVERQTGIRIRVISGTEEARLIHLAAGYGVDVGGKTAVVIDIGGGSVEITLGHRDAPDARQELQARRHPPDRTVRQERSAVGRRRAAAGEAHRREMGSYLDQIAARGFDRVIGTSGTILSLGASRRPRTASRPRTCATGASAPSRCAGCGSTSSPPTSKSGCALPGLDPRRADLSVAGAVLLDTILRRLGAEEFTLCDLALREGLVLDYIHRNSARIRKADRYPDVRRRSVIELGERCDYWPEHAQQVARLALALFDQTRSVHGLADREREWLEYGALLHDVGVHISYERHHRHSYYLIKNGDLRGFEPQEIEIIALVARYHRQATPKKSHEATAISKARCARPSKTLVGDGAARRRPRPQPRAGVAGIDLYPRGDDYLARLRATGDAELELWAAHRHVAPLEPLLGKPLRFEVAGNDYKEASRPRPQSRSC